MIDVPQEESAAVPLVVVSQDDLKAITELQKTLLTLSIAVHAVEHELAEIVSRIGGNHE